AVLHVDHEVPWDWIDPGSNLRASRLIADPCVLPAMVAFHADPATAPPVDPRDLPAGDRAAHPAQRAGVLRLAGRGRGGDGSRAAALPAVGPRTLRGSRL